MTKKFLIVVCITMFSSSFLCLGMHDCEKKNSSKQLSFIHQDIHKIQVTHEIYSLDMPTNQKKQTSSKMGEEPLMVKSYRNNEYRSVAHEDDQDGRCVQILTWILNCICC